MAMFVTLKGCENQVQSIPSPSPKVACFSFSLLSLESMIITIRNCLIGTYATEARGLSTLYYLNYSWNLFCRSQGSGNIFSLMIHMLLLESCVETSID
jgi:hypothetical protein